MRTNIRWFLLLFTYWYLLIVVMIYELSSEGHEEKRDNFIFLCYTVAAFACLVELSGFVFLMLCQDNWKPNCLQL
ncbi:hypothetical protein ACE6H2_022927 [Prunus campanulata]